jgi:cytochrome c5
LIRLFLIFLLQGSGSLIWAHEPLKFLAELEGKADAPQKIYQAYCQSCHDAHPKIPLGAPRAHYSQDWALRLKNKKMLLKHTYEGYQLMPARGGCFECSDDQLVQVIEYMIKKDGKNTH